jgi:hypothetical protein
VPIAIRDIFTFVGPSVIGSLARRTSAGHAVTGQAAAAPKTADLRKNWRLLIRFIVNSFRERDQPASPRANPLLF